ncbi:MAG: glycosyltransferase family 39 protein, partial [Sphingomicrobium sp.]
MTASTRGKFSALQISPLASLALLTAAGLALRFISIGKWPLWGDEGLTLLIGQWSIMNLFLAPIDPTPGLYYALHKIFLGPMVDAAGARSISLLCGTLLIPAVYFLAKEMRLPALLSAALTALSFPLIDYSQEARPYALLVLLTVLSAFCFVRWNRIGRLSDLLGALLFCLLAFYTHFVSIFWIGPIAAATFALARRKSALPLLLAAILAVPEVTRILRYREGGFAWLLEATPAQAADTLSRAFLPFRPTSPWLAVAAVLLGWRFWVHRSAIAAWVR